MQPETAEVVRALLNVFMASVIAVCLGLLVACVYLHYIWKELKKLRKLAAKDAQQG